MIQHISDIDAKLQLQTQHCAKVSCVNCCSDLQAIRGVNSEASDWLRWLPAHPHQLDDQLHLVAWRLLQRGTPYPATNTQDNETRFCCLCMFSLKKTKKTAAYSEQLQLFNVFQRM